MRFNPENEVRYRVRLAREYLEDAESRLEGGDYRGCVQYSQLSAENACKAVIATRRIPSWGHDPSEELLQIAPEVNSEHRERLKKLATIAARLAPERGRATYGEPLRMLTPRMLYDVRAAEESLKPAKEAAVLMQDILGTRTPD